MLTFLTPVGALAAVAVLAPLAAAVFGARRVDEVRAELRLHASRSGVDAVRLAAIAAALGLLALAATQPALSHETAQRIRRDAQALFVVDTSRSMAASAGRNGTTRLGRAKAAAARIRAAVPGVEAGVATLTDRVLPDLLPVADVPSFDATLQRAVGIEQPPPRSTAVRATTYAALGDIASSGFFAPGARHRVVVLLTDGESGPVDPGSVAASLKGARLVVVRVWRAGETIAGEPAYRSDPASSSTLEELAAAAGGRVFGEGDTGAAGAAVRADLGRGPTTRVSARTRTETVLAPFVALGALVPLGVLFLLRYRRRPRLEYD